MADSEADAQTNPFLAKAVERDAKSLEEFWLQVVNFALYSDDALKAAIADPKREDQVTMKLSLPMNGQSVVDINFRPENDQRWSNLCDAVQSRRLGLMLSMSDTRDNWRERTLCLRWSSFALSMQSSMKSREG